MPLPRDQRFVKMLQIWQVKQAFDVDCTVMEITFARKGGNLRLFWGDQNVDGLKRYNK